MVPIGDMMNHSNQNNVVYSYCQFTEGLTMVVNQDIPKGEELFTDYGK